MFRVLSALPAAETAIDLHLGQEEFLHFISCILCTSFEEYPQIPSKVEYSLSERGKSLMPILDQMCEWGNRNRASLEL